MKRVLSVLLCLLLPLCGAQAQTEADRMLDEAFERFSTLGACVAVFQNGRVTYTHTFGTREPQGESITEDTLFQVGSISKMIANIGLMQLLEQNGISLDEPIGTVLGYDVVHPKFSSSHITFRQLMTHTASLRDNHLYDEAVLGGGLPLQELITRQRNFTFYSLYKPGTHRQYSNFGGGIIGSLIEKLSGQTLDDYMQQNVFAPLGVNAAFQASRFPQDAPFADMYHMPSQRLGKRLSDDPVRLLTPDPEKHYFLTAGKLILSAPDLCRLLMALCDGGVYENARILKESTVAEMLTSQDYRGSVDCESKNGLFVNIVRDDYVKGRTLYGHGGRAYGMLCAAAFDPTDRTGVVMLTNGCANGTMNASVGKLGHLVMTICYEQLIDPTHRVEDPFAVQ